MSVPYNSLERRVRDLELHIKILQGQIRDQLQAQWVTPIAGRLWLFTLNEDMGATTSGQAAADLLGLDETDTGKDVTVVDPFDIFTDMTNTDGGICVEQLDVDGTRLYVIIQGECPP